MKLSVREICLIAMFTALTAVLAQIALPIPISPVPISFGMIAIYLTGMMLVPRAAVWSQALYLLLGACGVPVFHNFKGGLGILFGPTGGYPLTYPLVALVIALYFKYADARFNGRKKSPLYLGGAALALVAALLVLYAGGTAYLAVLMEVSFAQALVWGVYPYALLDLIKIVFTVLCFVPVRERLLKQGLKNELHQQHV